jgi:hypothetical protein
MAKQGLGVRGKSGVNAIDIVSVNYGFGLSKEMVKAGSSSIYKGKMENVEESTLKLIISKTRLSRALAEFQWP